MAISPTDVLSTLTNAQCGQLRDDLVALLVGAGIPEPTVRNVRRRLRMGIDVAADQKDAEDERVAVNTNNLVYVAHEAFMQPIRDRRAARQRVDYGPD